MKPAMKGGMPKKGMLLAMLSPKGDGVNMKGGAASGPDGDGPDSEGAGDEDADPEMLAHCGQEVMDSLQQGDPQAFAESLKAFISMC